MPVIESVKVHPSTIGEDATPGFAVIIDPPADTDHKKWQVAQAIKDKLDGLKLEGE